MDGIKIKVDDREFRAAMRGYERDIPFAISLGVNLIAKKATAELRANLREDGIHDRTGWIQKQIIFDRPQWATKARPVATIWSPKGIMKAAAEGGQRKFPGLVPVVGPGGARETIMSVIRGDLRRNANVLERLLLQQTSRGQGRKQARFVRRANTVYDLQQGGIKVHKREKGRLVLLAGTPVFRIPRAGVTIRPVWKIERRIALVQARWGLEIMAEAVDKAIKTSRPR